MRWRKLCYSQFVPHERFSLLDVPGLKPLADVCRRFSVQFTAYGAFVRRIAALLEEEVPLQEIDLFKLTPFISDIDLIHSGNPEQTPDIANSIQEAVPFAECFRWELRSQAEHAPFTAAMQTNGIIPANLLRLSTNVASGFVDPWHGREDIHNRKFRYIKNGFYSASPLFRDGRDLEFFSAILYLRILSVARIPVERIKEQPGWQDTQRVFKDARSDATVAALQESAYLRARLRYLLIGIAGSGQHPADIDRISNDSGLKSLLGLLANHASYDIGLEPARTLIASCRLHGDFFRLPHESGAWIIGADAVTLLTQDLKCAHTTKSPLNLSPLRTCVLASPAIPVRPGSAPSSSRVGEWPSEFVHFAVRLPPELRDDVGRLGEEGLTAVFTVGFKVGNESRKLLFSPAAVCHLLGPEKNLLTVRFNCGVIFTLLDTGSNASPVDMRVFVLAAAREVDVISARF